MATAIRKRQQIHRTARGLYTQYNRFHGIPEGGLVEANNVTIDRHGVVSKIRGRNRYGAAAAAQISQLLEYKDRILRHHGTTIDYDSDGAGAWTAYSGSFSAPASTHRIRAFEQILNLYFTSSDGVYKKATLADEPVLAGLPRALDLKTTKVGTGAGMFNVDTQVAYRVIFGRRDANEKLLRGAPSWREVATNAKNTSLSWSRSTTTVTVTNNAHGYSTGDTIEISDSSDTAALPNGPYTISNATANTYDVTVADTGSTSGTCSDGKKFNLDINFTIPDEIVAGDFYRVYRTQFSASATTGPGDEMKLVKEVELDAADITAGTITFTDSTLAAFLGLNLYTNVSEDGAALAKHRPPFCHDATVWKGHAWYLNTRQPHERALQFLETTGLVASTSSVTVTSGATVRTYTFASAEDFANQEFLLETSLSTEAENVEETMKSFCRAVNRDSGQSDFYALYTSSEDDAPGKIILFRRDLADTAITVTSDASTTGDNFSPELPTSGTTIASTADRKGNGLYHSLFEEAEAVPLASFDPIGNEFYEGLRVLALRDSLIVLTTQGIYRVSGESDGLAGDTFSVSQLDPSIHTVAPDCAVVLNNAVFCLSTQGVIRVDESGTQLVSHQIEDELEKLFGFPNFEERSFAVAYESDRKYILYRPSISAESVAKQADVFDYLTNTWCAREKTLSAAHVLFNEAKLYEAHGEDDFVLQERKSFGASGDDYRDEDIDVTVTAVSTTTNAEGDTVSLITLTYTYTGRAMATGFLFEQGVNEGVVEAFEDLGSDSYRLTMDTVLPSVANGAATVSLPINSRVRWRPEAAGNASVNKQWPEVTLFMEQNSATRHRVAFSSNVVADEVFVDEIDVIPGYGWGEGEWGEFGWGDEGEPPTTAIRAIVPRQHQRGQLLTLVYEHRRAKERFDLVEVAYTFRAYGEKSVRTPR